jgi:hypothetical protein
LHQASARGLLLPFILHQHGQSDHEKQGLSDQCASDFRDTLRRSDLQAYSFRLARLVPERENSNALSSVFIKSPILIGLVM